MLTEHADKFICILAGYKDEIQRDFFQVNPGIERRFTTFVNMEPYSPEEMNTIAEKRIKQLGFFQQKSQKSQSSSATQESAVAKNNANADDEICDVKVGVKYFKDVSLYKNCAGDVQSLVDKILLAHSKVSFGKEDKFLLLPSTVK